MIAQFHLPSLNVVAVAVAFAVVVDGGDGCCCCCFLVVVAVVVAVVDVAVVDVSLVVDVGGVLIKKSFCCSCFESAFAIDG